jgi:hypothetical protein
MKAIYTVSAHVSGPRLGGADGLATGLAECLSARTEGCKSVGDAGSQLEKRLARLSAQTIEVDL